MKTDRSFSSELACEITELLHRFDKTVVKIRVASATELTDICIVAVCVLCDYEMAAVSDVLLKSVSFTLWLHVIHSHESIICIPWQPLVNSVHKKMPFYASPQFPNALLTAVCQA